MNRLNSISVLLVSLRFLLLLISSTFGKVTLLQTGESFDSVPAAFGRPIKPRAPSILAYLQVIPNWPRLCPNDLREYTSNPGPILPVGDDNTNNNNDDAAVVVTPDDGRPVALLIERGNCTFFEKAQMASLWSPPVEYVIVYDNEYSNLAQMGSDVELHMDLGLLFVSRGTGLCE